MGPRVGRRATTLPVLVAFLALAVTSAGSAWADGRPLDGERHGAIDPAPVRLRGTLEARDEPPLPPEGTKYVVLTSESNLGDPDALLPLVLSFRKHHDDATGKVVLLSTASRAKDRTKWTQWADTHGVIVGFVKPPHKQIVIGRFFAYHAYVKRLSTQRLEVTAVAMMDATDVLFQSELMSRVPSDEVAYVLEPRHTTIGQCPVHRRWIEGCAKYGRKVWRRVSPKPRVCAGTVLGGVASVEKFLAAFTAEMTRTDFCNDQGVLNVMVHTGALGESPTLWSHEDGPVLSLNTAKEKDDATRAPTAPVLHFGHSSAWASRYLGRAGGELASEWRREREHAKVGEDVVVVETMPAPVSATSDREEGTGSATSDGGEGAGKIINLSVAFYVEAVPGDPRVAVDALKSIRRHHPTAPVLLLGPPGDDYTVLCRYYVCVAEVWERGKERERGADALGRGARKPTVGGGGGSSELPAGSLGGSPPRGAGTAVKGATSSISGDGGEWGEERRAAGAASTGGGPPEICGFGRASEFVKTVRSIARWAEGEGAEWLVMIDPATRIDAAVTRAPLSDANGAEDKHWTKPLDSKLLAKAKEVTGIDPAYRHSGLCGGSALRVKALTRGRLPKLPMLKGLDDRVDWWHDVALATYFFMNGYAISPWGDLRENGHPGPAHGPTAFERVANGDGLAPGALPLEGADRFLFRRVEPHVHAGHVPAGNDVFDPSAAERVTESDALAGLDPALASAAGTSSLFQDLAAIDLFAEALPWDSGDDESAGDGSAGGGVAAELGLEPFKVRLADVDENGRSAAPAVAAELHPPAAADPNGANGGYFLVALGPEYVEEAARLVKTLRKAGRDARPAAVLVRQTDAAYATSTGVFHRVVTYDPTRFEDDGLDALAGTSHERGNILPRLRAIDLSPYDEFAFVDTDVLCSAPVDAAWAALRAANQPIAAPGLVRDCNWHFGRVCEISEALGLKPQLPHVHAGVFYVNRLKDPAALRRFVGSAVEAFERYDELGFARLFREGSRVLEICLSYAHHKLGYQPVDFYRSPVINFNVPREEKLPTSWQRLGDGYKDRRSTGGEPYPLTHYFVKAGHKDDYDAQYKALTADRLD